ncbi:hypothetical protein PSEUBRA_005735 [Kalmanozyma brasiliensis GHG001]|uniref:uncharacterized protein n=1 Tax=Kalmanozyma brasiliensis (strain GHG001) TaxID=1365824 RepID=UPI00286814A9|nr:uncharacterized protein PSEUBRA_005735 [Kalmanozyma brasiliensis GHG001]KAF6767554.1 hypothetical protein PSEUBRA_005735 [Kalmanozyma brasiliensis GHG001]
MIQSAPEDNSAFQERMFAHCLNSAINALAAELEGVRDFLWQTKTNEVVLLNQVGSTESRGKKAHNVAQTPIYIAVDECVSLLQGRFAHWRETKAQDQLSGLRRTWNYIEQKGGNPIFYLLLIDTSSAATELFKPQRSWSGNWASLLFAGDPNSVFSGLTHDVNYQVAPPVFSAEQAFTLEHVKTYGRPLWKAISSGAFWKTMAAKILSCNGSYDEATSVFNNLDTSSALHYNIVAPRLALQFVTTEGRDYRGQDDLAKASVHRHMRMLQGVREGYRLDIGSPSEPPLAIGAALIMLDRERHPDRRLHQERARRRYSDVLGKFRTFCHQLLKTAVLRGSFGELTARIISIAAWDAAHIEADTRTDQDVDLTPTACDEQAASSPATHLLPSIARPIPLLDLIRQIVSLDQPSFERVEARVAWVRNEAAKVLDANDEAPNVEAWVSFTHFDTLPQKVDEISGDFLWYCWKRGLAIQTEPSQDGIDGIIPVFLGDLKRPFDTLPARSGSVEGRAARFMTYIAFEAKNQEESTWGREAAEALRGPNICGVSLTSSSLLSFYMDLGATGKKDDSGADERSADLCPPLPVDGPKRPMDEATTEQRKRQKTSESSAGITHSNDSAAPPGVDPDFLSIVLRGIASQHVYPCLDTLGIRSRIRELLPTPGADNQPTEPDTPEGDDDVDNDADNRVLGPLDVHAPNATFL